MYETILVASDGSDPANRAVEMALDIADTYEAEVHGLYIVDLPRYGKQDSEVLPTIEEQGQDVLEGIETRAPGDVVTNMREGRPEGEIVEYANEIDADLVVVGNRGLGMGPDGEVGSVAERVVRHAGRPVITA